MDLVRTLTERGGAARRGTLSAAGVTAAELRRAERAGAVTHPYRGVFALAGTPAASAAAVAAGGLLTCSSAAEAYGLQVLHEPESPHIAVPRNRSRIRVGGVVHWSDGAAGPIPTPVVTPVVMLAHASACLPFRDAVVIADSALNTGLLTLDELPRPASGGTTSPRLRAVLDHLDPGAQSLLETIARLAFRARGWRVETQVQFRRVGWVDLLVDGVLVVELDGREHHDSPDAFVTDRRRGNELTAHGMPLLRFTYGDVIHHEDDMVRLVARTLDRIGP